MKTFYRLSPVLVVLSILMTSCNPDFFITDPTEAPFHENGEGVVGTLGGIVMVNDPDSPIYGASVVIDEGSMLAPQKISISLDTNTQIPEIPDAVVVKFEPDGAFFDKPIAIALPYNPNGGSDPGIMHYDPESNSVTEMPIIEIDAVNGLIFVASDHFSRYISFPNAMFRAICQKNMRYYKAMMDNLTKKIFRKIEIGEQVWMADNLNVAVPQFPGSFIYRNNRENEKIYGRLYSFGEGEFTICPEGFRVPTLHDWEILIDDFVGDDSGYKLKSKMRWNGSDQYGFGALPGGMAMGNETYKELGSVGYYWTSTLDLFNSDNGFAIRFNSGRVAELVSVDRYDYISIRCIQGEGGGGGEINPKDTIVDTRDGKFYGIVKIGDDWWYAQNNNYTGQFTQTLTVPGDNYGNAYGRLYYWDNAKFSCPVGWHLSTDEDWANIEIELGMNPNEIHRMINSETGDVAYKLRSKEGWPTELGTNLSGFNALPSGYVRTPPNFLYVGEATHFWTSTLSETEDEAYYYRGISWNHPGVDRGVDHWRVYKSARCVKDRN